MVRIRGSYGAVYIERNPRGRSGIRCSERDGLCLGRAEDRDPLDCRHSKVRGWSCGSEFMAAYVCGRERGTPFHLIVELCSKSSPFTITTRSGVPCIMLTGEIEAIDGVSTQSPQDKEPRAKAIARVHEQPRMALRKAWGTSGCLIALFESREKLGSWSALPLGEPRLQMAKRGDWLRPRGSQNNAEVGKPPSTLR